MRPWMILILLSACGASPQPPREPDEYTGCGNDEHWRTFDDQAKAVVIDDNLAPLFTAPIPTAPLPFATRPTFAWKQDPNNLGMPTGDVPYMNGPGCTNCCPQFNRGALGTSHLPAISGNIYDLQLFVEGALQHRVVTTLQEWAPSEKLWSSWRGRAVTLTIYRLTLLKNDVKAGPYRPRAAFAFAVEN